MAATMHGQEKVWTERKKQEHALAGLKERYEKRKEALLPVQITQIENHNMSALLTFPRMKDAWLDYVAIQVLRKQLEDDQEVGNLI